jgi:hypothetical protein
MARTDLTRCDSSSESRAWTLDRGGGPDVRRGPGDPLPSAVQRCSIGSDNGAPLRLAIRRPGSFRTAGGDNQAASGLDKRGVDRSLSIGEFRRPNLTSRQGSLRRDIASVTNGLPRPRGERKGRRKVHRVSSPRHPASAVPPRGFPCRTCRSDGRRSCPRPRTARRPRARSERPRTA